MNTNLIIPDFEWYSAQGAKHPSGAPRCPFASSERCPRHHHSRSLLGEAGFTKMDAQDEARLDKRWLQLGLIPQTAEQCSAVMSTNGTPQAYCNFCPEVSYDSFGYFASHLHRYTDEIDSDNAHRQLSNINAPGNDWRWSWSHVRSMHYSECPFYSLLCIPAVPLRGDDGTADVTIKIWGLADVRFKWRARETFKAVQQWIRRLIDRSKRHVQAER